MNESQAREILNGEFTFTYETDPDSLARDKRYQKFSLGFCYIIEKAISTNIIHKAKLKIISEARTIIWKNV